MKFLSVSPDPRAAGMSDAVTSLEMGANAALYNPATMAHIKGNYSATGGVVQWIADINYNSASFIYKPGDGRFGVIGLNAVSVDYGEILATIVDENSPSGFADVGTVAPNGYAFGLSYANAITDQFSVGANFRIASMDLGAAYVGVNDNGYDTQSYSAQTGVLDFGILYKTGFESLNFAMALRNFSPGVRFFEEETELPLTFKIGISMDVFDLTDIDKDTHSLLVSIDANRPRDYDEQLLFGLEYSFVDRFMLRGGYGFPKDEEQFSIGGGIKQPIGGLILEVNYAYTKFGVFGEVNRFGVQLGF
ncbi:MAG TPA: DUF3308 domain-containing protein [Balneolaceae bacterium]|nr:DUF3308 domain-containing protein [Balneolaceae bacterium]